MLSIALAGCIGEPPAEPIEPTFASIEEHLLRSRCTGPCHSGGEENAAGHLDLSVDPWTALVEAPARSRQCGDEDRVLVVPGRPDESLLWKKLEARAAGHAPPCGVGMPPPPDRPAVPDEARAAVRSWIETGALAD